MPRKRVAQEVLDGVPTIGPNQQVVRIVQVCTALSLSLSLSVRECLCGC
jgi:hypothetical protein